MFCDFSYVFTEADDEDVENCEYLVDSDTDEEVQEQLDSNAVEAPDYLDYNDEVNDESVSPSTMLEAKDIPLPAAAADRADYGTKTGTIFDKYFAKMIG